MEPVASAPVPPASSAPETTAVPAAAAPEASTTPDGPVDPWAHLRKHEEPENWRAARRIARKEAKEKEREEAPAAATAPKRRSGWRRLLLALAILVAIALVLLVAYVVVARLAPGFVDRFLYSAEELEFIREAYE